MTNVAPRPEYRSGERVPESRIARPNDVVVPPARKLGVLRADCCVAPPLMRAVLPSTATRARPVELLLCGHHCRVARVALAVAGAAVFDLHGQLLASGDALAHRCEALWPQG